MTRRWRGRRRAAPITAQVLLLALAAVAAAQTISFAVILLTPAPTPPRMTLAAAGAALASEEGAQAAGLVRRLAATPPLPPERGMPRLYSHTLAFALGAHPDAVRVRSLSAPRLGPGDDDRSLVITMPPDGPARARLERPPDRPEPFSPELARQLLSGDFPLPAFEAAVRRPDGRWVHVAPPTPFAADWRFRLALSFLLGLVVVIPLAWAAARRMTGPIRALARAAGESHLGTRPAFPEDGPPEVREASAALSAMHARIARQFEERMRMLVAIAHDLRTPLTALRLRIEAAPGEERARQAGLIRRMEHMIREILDYAASARGETPEEVDVAAIVRGLLPAADALGNPIRFHGETGLNARLPPARFERAVANLIDNAVRYAADIEVSATRRDGAILVTVADRGPGIAEADLARVQEPFERIEGSRSRRTGGIGLGLTIARDLAAGMNGALTLRNRKGGGLAATLSLDGAFRR